MRPKQGVTGVRISAKLVVTAVAMVAVIALTSACNGGLRPALVEDASPTPLPQLELDLPPAPPGTPPLPPTTADFPLESSVDDALIAWATDRNVAYVDSCRLVTPEPGQFCDTATERDTVRLLGPSADTIWYIVTVQETGTLQSGGGFRVSDVRVVE